MVNPERYNFTILVKKCETYDIYETIKLFFDKIICKSDDWVKEAKQYFPNKQNITDSKFKKWFIQQYKERMKILWYKLWKAGYYYFNT